MERKKQHRSSIGSRNRNAVETGVQSSPLVRILRGSILGVVIAALTSLLLLGIFAWFLSLQADPDAYLYPCAFLMLGLSSLLVGIVSVRISNAAFFQAGIVSAVLWLLLTGLISLAVFPGIGSFPPVYALALRIPQILFVLFGAFLGKSRPRKINSRRRH